MLKLSRYMFRVSLFITVLGIAAIAYAVPTNVSVTPPTGARFLPGQKFDLRWRERGLTIPGDHVDGAPNLYWECRTQTPPTALGRRLWWL